MAGTLHHKDAKYLVIGSWAIALRENYVGSYKFLDRPVADFDYIAPFELVQRLSKYKDVVASYPTNKNHWVIKTNDGKIRDIEIAWPGSTGEELIHIIHSRGSYMSGPDEGSMVPDFNVLLTLKESHKYLKNNPHFEKTRNDILTMRALGIQMPDWLHDWYIQRKKATYWYQHPKLNQSKKDFFTDDVPYKYDHDDTHKAIALGNRPAYLEYKINEEEVLCSEAKFLEQSEEVRLAGVYEEATVLALERSQVPYPDCDPLWSFKTALQKVCTSITSGWFREYAWENYDKVMDMYDPKYVEKFNGAVERGEVRAYTRA